MNKSAHIKKIKIEVSDPWDFGTAHGTGPFNGELLKIFKSSAYNFGSLAVIKLEKAIYFNNIQYEYLLVQPRHEGASLSEINKEKNLNAISWQLRLLLRKLTIH